MKKFIHSACLCVCISMNAQLQTPESSPAATLMQTVGLTDFTVKFSRPSARGRKVIGNLVSFDHKWRTGANDNTTIQVTDSVKIEGQPLAAGTYAVFTQPGEQEWEIYFYTDTDNSRVPKKWELDKVAATVKVTPKPTGKLETFSIWFSDLTYNDAHLNLAWENTKISMKVEVPTDAKTMASIKQVMNNDPKERDYYEAAVYYLQTGRDLKQAKEWVNKAVSMNDNTYWYFRQQALILAGLNEMEAAIEAAKKSLVRAEKAGNLDYVKLNTDSIADWSK